MADTLCALARVAALRRAQPMIIMSVALATKAIQQISRRQHKTIHPTRQPLKHRHHIKTVNRQPRQERLAANIAQKEYRAEIAVSVRERHAINPQAVLANFQG